MAGVKQFDIERAVDCAMRVFWQCGYEATSMDDLARATGVTRGSLYNAFGDKEQILLAALGHYGAVLSRPVFDALQLPDARAAIAGMLDAHIARMCNPANPPGCLMTAMCLECAGHSGPPAISAKIADQFRGAETAIYKVLLRGQAQGQIAPARDLRALARFFVATTRGMAAMHKALGDLSAVRDVARVALEILDVPIPPSDPGRIQPSSRAPLPPAS